MSRVVFIPSLWATRRVLRVVLRVVLKVVWLCVPLQAETFKKRGSVKAETSLAAVELSGHVTRRGYLLKQVTNS